MLKALRYGRDGQRFLPALELLDLALELAFPRRGRCWRSEGGTARAFLKQVPCSSPLSGGSTALLVEGRGPNSRGVHLVVHVVRFSRSGQKRFPGVLRLDARLRNQLGGALTNSFVYIVIAA